MHVRMVPTVDVLKSEPELIAPLRARALEVASRHAVAPRRRQEIADLAFEAWCRGMRAEWIAGEFVLRGYYAEADEGLQVALLIIRNVNALMERIREERTGITHYFWRVVTEHGHGERSGRRYAWADPPEGGHPGQAAGCTCYAEGDLADLLDEQPPRPLRRFIGTLLLSILRLLRANRR